MEKKEANIEKKEKKHDKKEFKPKEEAPKPAQAQPAQAQVSSSGKEIRGIIRLAGRDIKGGTGLFRALNSIKGVGKSYARVMSEVVAKELSLPETAVVGELSEQQADRLEYILSHPTEFGVPAHMINRRLDFWTGAERHLIGTDLDYVVKQDIEHERDSFTWKGYRHAYGQKVRGQHTKTTGRTGMTVGVLRKAILAKAGAAATAQTGAAAQAAGPVPAAGKAGLAPKGAGPAKGAAAAPAAQAAKPAAPTKEAKK